MTISYDSFGCWKFFFPAGLMDGLQDGAHWLWWKSDPSCSTGCLTTKRHVQKKKKVNYCVDRVSHQTINNECILHCQSTCLSCNAQPWAASRLLPSSGSFCLGIQSIRPSIFGVWWSNRAGERAHYAVLQKMDGAWNSQTESLIDCLFNAVLVAKKTRFEQK